MKKFTEKVIGTIILILGALPFLLKIKIIEEYTSKVNWLNWFLPGNYVYQILIILIGLFILLERRVEYHL